MKTILIYKSKSGYTEAYAKWISEELNCELKSALDITVDVLKEYDTIIYGGGLYAVGINGIKLINKNYTVLKDKNIVVWATGACTGKKEELKEIWNYNFSDEQLALIKTFYLRGGFNYKKLNTSDKILMSMLKVKLKLKKDRTEDEQGMLDAYNIEEYHCNRENIKELVEYVRSLRE